MICSLYDESLNRIAIIGTMRSLVWCEGYSEAGVSQMVVTKSAEYAEKIKCGRFIGIDSSDTLQVIVQISDNDGQIWIYMRECKWILDDRIYIGTFKCRSVETSLKAAVTASRPYGMIDLADDRGLEATIKTERTYKSIYDISCAVCEAVGYGFRLIHDREAKKLKYDVYAGAERIGVKFSEKFGNMRNAILKICTLDWKNVAYVGGAGEGSERIFATVGDEMATEFERRELFVDARDIQKDEGESDASYLQKLEARGREKLAERKKVENVEFEVNPAGYGSRFSLGDRVTAIFSEHGLNAVIRIMGIKRKFENNMESLELTLGDPIIRRDY